MREESKNVSSHQHSAKTNRTNEKAEKLGHNDFLNN
jgi:hypothetical protein